MRAGLFLGALAIVAMGSIALAQTPAVNGQANLACMRGASGTVIDDCAIHRPPNVGYANLPQNMHFAWGNIQVVPLSGYTVATLPTCNAAIKGSMAYVTDATTPTYNAALSGSGAVIVPVFCTGAAWTSH